jgi:hypothetical protein
MARNKFFGAKKSYNSAKSSESSGIFDLESVYNEELFFPAEPGGHVFTEVGTTSWTCPEGVESVCVVCVGGGGGGYAGSSYARGGGGGGLGWKNNIPVTPGQSYTVTVGAAGERSSYGVEDATSGGDSFFIDLTTVSGQGGDPGGNNKRHTDAGYMSGGSYTGDGGGSGGKGGYGYSYCGGGGGAGGYTGGGGSAYVSSLTVAYKPGLAGSGGGGGGGGAGGSSDAAGNGGGVGIYGQGTNGARGEGTSANGKNGYGGSGGQDGGRGGGLAQGSSSYVNSGGDYGGGGGAADSNSNGEHGSGGQGAVRIIWGAGRAFPETNVDLASSTAGESTN